ncbi:hypothetical protein CGGC5_v010560 [Colletotrichum fructicola Nara gc5]|uniref:Uncharacterized protein n=1 Tax=Colletotrichum fructicola (strain Nara gc5) TaxID=1213859 RepID=A0A7J6IVJ1_COLFN|nr:hypothetical protein CGGC5_v010560 [Colletotrichum fructicola Nara gc5]
MDEDRSPNDERDAARSESKSGKDPNNNRTGSASFHSQQSVDHGSSSTFGGHSSVSGPQTSEIRQSRQSRIEYAQMYPSHAYTHREGNSIANASAALLDLGLDDDYPQVHRGGELTSYSENYSSYLSDSKARRHNQTLSSSRNKPKKPALNEQDQGQVHNTAINSEVISQETSTAQNDKNYHDIAITITCEWEIPKLCVDND